MKLSEVEKANEGIVPPTLSQPVMINFFDTKEVEEYDPHDDVDVPDGVELSDPSGVVELYKET
ncbi:MAG: hypothetical protein WC375_07760 [Methanomassiliicoccales archaeon]|jgi:hypothetical protein